jgi:ISXO2-like transposase domain
MKIGDELVVPRGDAAEIFAENQTGKRKVVVIAREKGSKTLPFVFRAEGDALTTLGERVEVGSTVHADEARHWDALHTRYLTKRINHQDVYSNGVAECVKRILTPGQGLKLSDLRSQCQLRCG